MAVLDISESFRWDEVRRAQLRAELDAYYARLYGLTRDELRYILDPKEVHGEDFPGETFRVLKEKVMGYEKEAHLKDKHGGKSVEWNRMK